MFTEIVVNLKTPEYKGLSTPLNDNEDLISNMIKKYKNHSIVIAIKNAFPSHSFVFETVRRDKILKEIKNLEFIQGKKVMFQRKLLKENAELFTGFSTLFQRIIQSGVFFLLTLKRLMFPRSTRKDQKIANTTTYQSGFYHIF